MANGFAPYLLRNIQEVALSASPDMKVTPTGWLKYLAENAAQAKRVINEGWEDGTGHIRDMKIAYDTRGTEQDVVDTDDCDIEIIPSKAEATVDLDFYSKLGIYISDETMAQYMADASRTVAVGQPATPMMNELIRTIIIKLNGFFQKMDDNLLGAMVTNFGVNVRTGNNAATSLNFSKDASVQSLASGIAQILADVQINEMSGVPAIVGSGLFHQYQLQQVAKGLDGLGIDTSRFLNAYQFFYDPKTADKWGTNQIGVFEPNSVLLLQRNKYQGAFAGERGNSTFFTMMPPLVDSLGSRHLDLFNLDCQLKYIDCPTEVNTGYYDHVQTVTRGWQLIVSKPYGLWTLPSDAYASDDRLYGANGTLRYTVTNDCETCD